MESDWLWSYLEEGEQKEHFWLETRANGAAGGVCSALRSLISHVERKLWHVVVKIRLIFPANEENLGHRAETATRRMRCRG